MQKETVKIINTSVHEVVDYLKREISFDYLNLDSNFFVMGIEKFYFRNNSTQMNLIIGKNINGSLVIDIIAGAGGSGLFNFSWGSTTEFVNKAFDLIQKYAGINNKSIEIINSY